MQDQPALALLADPLPDAGPADQISGQRGVLTILDVPGDDLAAPDVDHQIEVEPHAPHTGGQVGDVPAPELVGAISTPPGHRARLLRRPGPSAALHLLVGVEHAVEAALGGQVLAPVGQGGHDLRRRQRGVLRLVADRQDLLPLLLAEAMGHMANAAFAAVPTVPITRELPPPPLPRALCVQPPADRANSRRHLRSNSAAGNGGRSAALGVRPAGPERRGRAVGSGGSHALGQIPQGCGADGISSGGRAGIPAFPPAALAQAVEHQPARAGQRGDQTPHQGGGNLPQRRGDHAAGGCCSAGVGRALATGGPADVLARFDGGAPTGRGGAAGRRAIPRCHPVTQQPHQARPSPIATPG